MQSRAPSPEQPSHSDPDQFGAIDFALASAKSIAPVAGPWLASVLRLILRFSALPGLPAPYWPTKKTPCGTRSLTIWSQADSNR